MQAEALHPLLRHHYGLNVLAARHADEGAGSDTWFVTCEEGNYVVKYPAANEINHPEQEPELCQKLLDAGIPVSASCATGTGSSSPRTRLAVCSMCRHLLMGAPTT